MSTRIERANAIRFLSIDAVERAKSGHPGMPMGMADIAEVLWHDFLHFNPANPHWLNRDRFILSNGHGCMLQYALLHLTGYALTIDDLKRFRQLHSKTPGHPEYGYTPGVETTTGPLGQGFGNAVGMAIAAKHLAATFNRPHFPIIDHHIYCFVGDGCLMEGISHEVASLAGTLGLHHLIVIYDDNRISIDGETEGWFTDDTPARFEAYGWQVLPGVDGHDSEAIRQALLRAQASSDKPTLICCRTQIGFGAPSLAGSAKSHGAPLGEAEIAAARRALNWPYAAFEVPEHIYADWDKRAEGAALEAKWQALFVDYQKQYPREAEELQRRISGALPMQFAEQAAALVRELDAKKQFIATRKASQLCLDYFAPLLSELFGGSADLTESNCTNWKDMTIFSKQTAAGRYLHYGVREFGMSAIMNGMALTYGILPFGGTFLTFSDYARNALRLAALMRTRTVFVYTHDSIGLGEDGPTHQPVEHLPSLRIIPHLSVWRPCDTVETAVAWQKAIERQGPTCLLLSRQNLAFQTRDALQLANISRGGYVLADFAAPHHPEAIIIATGSEVALSMEAAQALHAGGLAVRVVSMPSVDVFLAQEEAYREEVLPARVRAKVVVEAASGLDWYRLVGLEGAIIGVHDFGLSAPAAAVFHERGITKERVVSVTQQLVAAFQKPAGAMVSS